MFTCARLWFRLSISLCVCDHAIVSIVKSSVCYFLFYCGGQPSFLFCSPFPCSEVAPHVFCVWILLFVARITQGVTMTTIKPECILCMSVMKNCNTFESSCETRSLMFSCPLTHLQLRGSVSTWVTARPHKPLLRRC